jgi:molybdopterin/thiamine biosynthesis adenylyltransferase
MLNSEDELTLFDGDTVEGRNLDRQFFHYTLIGEPKVAAIQKILSTTALVHEEPRYFTSGYPFVETPDLIFCCADNHVARVETLKAADIHDCLAIVAANEYFEAESYIYQPHWKGSELDPRVYFPEMLTDTSDNPLDPGCTGASQEEHPQLASANFMAAAFALNLYTYWFVQRDEGLELEEFDPVRYSHAVGKTRTWTRREQAHYGRQFNADV